MATQPPYTIVLAPIADVQIDAALSWWKRNRPLAPGVLARELDAALDVIGFAPKAGQLARLRGHPGARRLLLRASGYHLHYVTLEQAREVRIVYFRHARRRPRG